MKRNLLKLFFIILIISINIGCDQSTKYMAKKYLNNDETIQLIDNYFILHYVENRGAFLSVFSDLPVPIHFILLSVFPSFILILMLFYMIFNTNLSRLQIFALCNILGGGISNVMIDRLYNNQSVVDFMNLGIGNIRTGIFNFADISIMLGVCIILFIQAKNKKRDVTCLY